MSNSNKNNNNYFKDLFEEYENHEADIAAEEQEMKEDSSSIVALQQQFVTNESIDGRNGKAYKYNEEKT
jgi:hypothetical protein